MSESCRRQAQGGSQRHHSAIVIEAEVNIQDGVIIQALGGSTVLGVPMSTWDLGGLDSLLSMVQMPGGIPVGTTAIGKANAKNAAFESF